jgi:hypothetical protein
MTTTIDHWADRVDGGDWDRITEELNEYGGALLPRLLTSEEAVRIAGLYEQDEHFRSTVNMGRHRFGEGEYRYFARPFPEPIEQLKQALYPHLLPIARDWWDKLGRPAPWPDTLDAWLAMCHAAGQTKSTPILLKYGGEGLERAPPRPVRRPRVSAAGRDQPERPGGRPHRGRVPAAGAAPPVPVARDRDPHPPRSRPGLHHPGPARGVQARMVRRPRPPRCVGDPLRPPVHPGAGVPRRRLSRRAPAHRRPDKEPP